MKRVAKLVIKHLEEHLDFKLKCTLYSTRCFLSAVSAGLSLAYIFIWLFGEKVNNVNYVSQTDYMPIYMYIMLFSLVSAANFATAEIKYRLSIAGRVAALAGGSIFLLYALTYVPTFSVTALCTYSVISMMFFWEAFGDN